MKKRTAWIGVAVAAGSLVASAVPAMAAVTVSSPPAGVYVHIDNGAKISARGAAITVRLSIVCPSHSNAYLFTSVSERSGKSIAIGSQQKSITCTGIPQTVTAYLQSANRPFVVGSASVSTDFQVYNNTTSVDLTAHGTRSIVK